MEDVLKFKHLTYDFRNVEARNRSNVNSVKYGTEIIISFGAKIWTILPNDYKELTSLSTFKSKIKNWGPDECPSRLCKTYIQRVGLSWFNCWALLRQVDVCQQSFLILFYFILFLFLFLFILFSFLHMHLQHSAYVIKILLALQHLFLFYKHKCLLMQLIWRHLLGIH